MASLGSPQKGFTINCTPISNTALWAGPVSFVRRNVRKRECRGEDSPSRLPVCRRRGVRVGEVGLVAGARGGRGLIRNPDGGRYLGFSWLSITSSDLIPPRFSDLPAYRSAYCSTVHVTGSFAFTTPCSDPRPDTCLSALGTVPSVTLPYPLQYHHPTKTWPSLCWQCPGDDDVDGPLLPPLLTFRAIDPHQSLNSSDPSPRSEACKGQLL